MSLNLRASTDRDEEIVSDEYRAIFYDSDIGKRIAAAGSAATQS